MAKKILIVDDDPSIVELLKFTLEDSGYITLKAFNGEDALQSIKKDKPNLVLLDIMLPTKDGFSILEEIRESKEFKEFSLLPIVIISAKVQEVDISFGLELGANDYLTKPLDLPNLVKRVKEILQEKGD